MKNAVIAATLLLAVHAACADAVHPPAGFGIRPTGELRRVIHSERTGTLPNTVDRAALEPVCKASVGVGSAKRMPQFGPGDGEPLRTRIVQFITPDARQYASFTEITAYHCDKAVLKSDGPCGCDYHSVVQHRVEIGQWKDGRMQRWQVNLAEGSGVHDAGAAPSSPAASATQGAMLDLLFGAVSGQANVAGFRCDQRERTVGTALQQTCLARPDPKLPEMFWGRSLATQSRDTSGARPGFQLGSALQHLDVDAQVDAGVFEPPAGIAYRSVRLPPMKDPAP